MKRFFVVLLIVIALVIGYFLGVSSDRRRPSDLSLQDVRATTAVRTALALNKHLDGTGITVEVTNGQAALGGTVRSGDQRRLAEEIASSIEGVSTVVNNITVDATSGAAPDARTRSLGERLDDLTTATRVRAALALHKDIDRGDVSVELYKGTATLTGTVPTWAARELAGKVTEDVEGVQHVDNQIDVKETHIQVLEPEGDLPAEQPRGTGGVSVPQQIADGAVQLQIETALRMKPQIDARRVHVEVINGVAHLTGVVANEAERSLIGKVAEDCWGVSRVINDITFNEEETEQAPASTTP